MAPESAILAHPEDQDVLRWAGRAKMHQHAPKMVPRGSHMPPKYPQHDPKKAKASTEAAQKQSGSSTEAAKSQRRSSSEAAQKHITSPKDKPPGSV